MKITILALAIIIIAEANEVEIKFTERTDKNLPTSHVILSVNGKDHILGDTGSDNEGIVTKDGKYAAFNLAYDSNNDGKVDFADLSKLHVYEIRDGTPIPYVVKENAGGAFDVTGDGQKLLYCSYSNNKASMHILNLITLNDEIMISNVNWIGHIRISQDDKKCAFYIHAPPQYKNQVVIADANGAIAVSEPVGNSWGLSWNGKYLLFLEKSKVVVYDTETNSRVNAIDENHVDSNLNKMKSGWPEKAKTNN